jgi:outer membrane protein assembly factor BamB
MRSRSRLCLCVVAVVLVLAGLPASAGAGSDGGGVVTSRSSRAGGDWAMWGYDVQRSGFNPSETTLSPSTVSGLHLLWRFRFEKKSDSAPVLASGVTVGGKSTDLLYAGDRTGAFDAVDASTGKAVWSHSLGTNVTCAGTLGVTDTAVIDRSTNRVYVAGGDGRLYAFDLATGAPALGWPLAITTLPNEYIWSAIGLFNGNLYVTVASGCDGLGPYYGRVVRVDPITVTRTAVFYVTGGPDTGVSGGGIWGWGGASMDPATGDVYVATGNGFPDKKYEHYLYAEHVVRLTGDLSVVSANYPGQRGRDVDFGSTPVLYKAPGGCGPQLMFESKSGEIFVYNRNHLEKGPVDRVAISSDDLIGVGSYDPAARRLFVGNRSTSADGRYRNGLLAFRIRSDCTLRLSWQRTLGTAGLIASPVSANGVVYFGDGHDHQLFAFDIATHKKLWTSGNTFMSTIQTEPIVVGGRVYLTTGKGLYAFGL